MNYESGFGLSHAGNVLSGINTGLQNSTSTLHQTPNNLTHDYRYTFRLLCNP